VNRRHVVIPAISREIEFCAHNARTMEAVLDSDEGSPLAELTARVAQRANKDTDRLLRDLEAAVANALAKTIRLRWVNTNRAENWWSWGKVYMPRGPMRSIAHTGIILSDEPMPLRLIGWLWPRWGGIDGRREFVHRCSKKIKRVCLPHEDAKRYPGWTEEDGIIWLDEQLTLRTAYDDLLATVATQARRFFRSAKPILKALAER
jgi:hypothetical protein